jgi:hypothetical protein
VGVFYEEYGMNVSRAYYLQELLSLPSDAWQTLLDFGLSRARQVEFALDGRTLPASLQAFSASLLEQFSSRMRWQARQIGYTTFARFQLGPELSAYLKSVPRLGGWMDERPQDPTLYRDEEKILWTISHDEMAFVCLSEREAARFNERGFTLTRIET